MADNAPARRTSLTRATALLTASSFVTILTGFITGPILARTLGPEGRGLVAAILVPLTLVPAIAAFSAGDFANRCVARGMDARRVAWSLLPLTLVFGALTTVVLVLLAPTLSAGEDAVRDGIALGALVLPIGLVVTLGMGVVSGKSRWGVVSIAVAVPALANTIAIVTLAVLGELTVESAAAATILSALLGAGPLLARSPRRVLRPARPVWTITREGIGFGARSLPGVVAVAISARLDQALMLSLSNARELGLYAIAVTIASGASALVNSIATAVTPAVAAGDHDAAARGCRVALAVAAAVAILLAALGPFLLRVVFGPEFADAYPTLLVLLVAQVVIAGSVVLGFSLRAANRPGAVSWADLAAVAVTVPGLFLLLPPLGGLGAALVSLVSYSVVFVLLLRVARREFGFGWRTLLIAGGEDLRPIITKMRGRATRVLHRRRP